MALEGNIEIKNLNHVFQDIQLYQKFDFTIEKGRVTAITGPSGCGKTTLLRLLCGLEPMENGGLTVLSGLTAGSRVAVVFQEDRLLPWLTVRENLALVAPEGAGRAETIPGINEILSMVELLEFGDYYPEKLSGGMQRRVAIGRALLYGGDLLLLDEPFKGLDEALKRQLMGRLKAEWKRRGSTVVLVTHDVEDIRELADCLWEFSGRPVKSRLIFG